MTNSQTERARRLYRSGLTQAEVAQRLGCEVWQARYAITKAPNHQRRYNGGASRRKLTLDKSQLVDARKRGLTFAEIGRPFGVTRQAVSSRLRYTPAGSTASTTHN